MEKLQGSERVKSGCYGRFTLGCLARVIVKLYNQMGENDC